MGRFDVLTKLEENKVKTPSPARSPIEANAPQQVIRKVGDDAKKPANPQTSKPENLQTGKPAKPLISYPISELPEKYSTRLEPSLVKKIKVHAAERDMNDYDVVKNALLEYFERHQ